MEGPTSYYDTTLHTQFSANNSLDAQDAIKEGVPATFGVRSLSSSYSQRSGSPTRTLSRKLQVWCSVMHKLINLPSI
jgi:hypothetical protein